MTHLKEGDLTSHHVTFVPAKGSFKNMDSFAKKIKSNQCGLANYHFFKNISVAASEY